MSSGWKEDIFQVTDFAMNFSALTVVFVNRWPAVVCFTTFEHTAVTATVLHLATVLCIIYFNRPSTLYRVFNLSPSVEWLWRPFNFNTTKQLLNWKLTSLDALQQADLWIIICGIQSETDRLPAFRKTHCCFIDP
jgi:hypothetical protein